MKSFRVSENIVPVSEFKAQAAEMLRRLAGSGEPLVITQNGRATAVLLSPNAYDELTERARFVAAVLEGIEDIKAGRLVPHKQLRQTLRPTRTHGSP